MQRARKLPGQSMLQEFFVLANSIHQQIKVLLNSIGLFKQGTWYCGREQGKGSVVYHLQTRMRQQKKSGLDRRVHRAGNPPWTTQFKWGQRGTSSAWLRAQAIPKPSWCTLVRHTALFLLNPDF